MTLCLRRRLLSRPLLVALCILLPGALALAVEVPEVQDFRFLNQDDFEWAPLPQADTYNVYRGDPASLPASYGNCFSAGTPALTATDPAQPLPGTGWASAGAFIYLVSGLDASGASSTQEGTLGFEKDAGLPVLERSNTAPCFPLPGPGFPRISPLNPNGPQPDGVIQGQNPPNNPMVANDLNKLAAQGVYLQTGEFFMQVVDMEIPGRGLNWRQARTYRNQINHDGPMGLNWTHNYDRRIFPAGPNLIYMDGMGRQDEFFPLGAAPPRLYEPVTPGVYAKIFEDVGGQLTYRTREGTLYHHFPITGSPLDGALESIEDRMGNRLTFLYHSDGLLCNVVDTYGRTIDYFYDTNSRLTRVLDFDGRETRYEYDAGGRLTSVRSPVVVGTPTGNDFPGGSTTRYEYDASDNLLRVFAPNEVAASGPPVIQNFYNGNDELFQQIHGSGTAQIQRFYNIVLLGGGFRDVFISEGGPPTHRFLMNPQGQALEEETFTIPIRPTDPPSFLTTHNYNAEGERVVTTLPMGNQVLYQYDSGSPDLFQRGNLMEVRRVADGRGDGFGGVPNDIVASYGYEPLYNQMRVIVDPMNNDPLFFDPNDPDKFVSRYTYCWQEGDPVLNGVNQMLARWNILLPAGFPVALGDVNGDGDINSIVGNPVRLDQPDTTLVPGGRQQTLTGAASQSIRTLWIYNPFTSQLIAQVDPEGNVTLYEYYPEDDPDGDGLLSPPPLDGRTLDPVTGGMLSRTLLDADPTPFLAPAELAARNNFQGGTPTLVENVYAYDPAGNLIRSVDANGIATRFDVNARGQIVQITRAEGTAEESVSQQIYDANGAIVQRRVQDNRSFIVDQFFDIEFSLDIRGDVTEMREDDNSGGATFSTTKFTYDAHRNRVEVIRPRGNRVTIAYDERNLPYRLVRGDNDANALNGGPPGSSLNEYTYDQNGNPTEFIDGLLQVWPFEYDGFDRRVRSHNQPLGSGFPVDTFFDVLYLPNELVARHLVRTPVQTLHSTRFEYDELGRVVRTRQELLDTTGAFIAPTEDADGDGVLLTTHEYDRSSRRSIVVDDGGGFQHFNYDGAGRLVEKRDATLSNSISYEYDSNGNLLRSVEQETLPLSTEQFLSTYAYDSLNRITLMTDSLGQSMSHDYDARDHLILTTDRLGNTVSYEYDAVGRRTLIARDLRVGGTGAGGVFDTLRHQLAYDANGNLAQVTDPNLNPVSYVYDDLDRKIQDTLADGSTYKYSYDANDNVVQVEDANSSVVEVVYDAADRLVARNTLFAAAGVVPVTQTFDYDPMNRLVLAEDVSLSFSRVEFGYDSLNRVRREETQFSGNPARVHTYAYDAIGNRRTASLETGTGGSPNAALVYAADALGRLSGVNEVFSGYGATYDYFGPERIANRTHGNATRKSHADPLGTANIGYDGLKRVVSVVHYDGGGAADTQFDYLYDAESNLRAETRVHDGSAGDVYVYDSAYRLTRHLRDIPNPAAEVSLPGSGGLPPRDTEYTLDGVGNWAGVRVDDTVEPFRSGDFGNHVSSLNEYSEKPDDGLADDFLDDVGTAVADGGNLAYDRNGNLLLEQDPTTGQELEHQYDVLNRLVQSTDTVSATVLHTYSYDGLNRQVSRQGPGLPDVRNVHDGRQLAAEVEIVAGVEVQTLQRYFYGAEGTPVATFNDASAQLYYLHEDVRGSIRAATDSTGAVVERVTYGPQGRPEFRDPSNIPSGVTSSITGNRFLFQSKSYDPVTGLYFESDSGGVFNPRHGRHLQRILPGAEQGPLGLAFNVPLVFPSFDGWIGFNPWWWCKGWFWVPWAWNNGWWGWNHCWWWGGPWRWWSWRPWLWWGWKGAFWWNPQPWAYWWCTPFGWWGWPSWSPWWGWWGFWPWWGWGGWSVWHPVWGWGGWWSWWGWWGWYGWSGWWPNLGWWGWWGWWPRWTVWWWWHPWWWHGWWTWSPWWWHGWWGWSGLTFWWNWSYWINWWPWGWWNWAGWWGWWGWWGWNPWWWGGWWRWPWYGWVRGLWFWWGPVGWWNWFGWGWLNWWWWGWWPWAWWWGWWIWPWWGWGWSWWWGWSWAYYWWSWPAWGWWRWWGWWWPWFGWWC